ncbi:MAG: hypothetical protein R3C03_20785 [Pirellulaceae bacterium]
MGKIVFALPAHWDFERRTATTLHVVGLDGIPWPCKVARENNLVSISRNRDESGHVFVAYPFREYGELTIATGTLPESEKPYRLLKELARGTLNRLRNQISNWLEGGLEIDSRSLELLNEAVDEFGQCALAENDTLSDQHAERSLNLAIEAVFKVSRLFGESVFPLRTGHINVPKHWLGCEGVCQRGSHTAKESIGGVFDIFQIQTLDECNENFENIVFGPLLDASPGGMLKQWQELADFEERQVDTMRSCREFLAQAPGSVKLLHVASGLNGVGHRLLSYPQQLQLTLDLLEMIENSSRQIPTLVSFDCPWGERLAWSVGGVHPLQIADSILRRGVTVSMLGLDINLDYWPNGCLPRDPLQWLELIDVWSQLGLPLVVRLCAPTFVKSLVAVDRERSVNATRESMNDTQMQDLLKTVIPMMLARPAVQGIIWSQGHDGGDIRYPSAGLVDIDGQAKPIANIFTYLNELAKRG